MFRGAWTQGRALGGARACRSVGAGETPTVSLRGGTDRPNLDGARMAEEFGLRAAQGMEDPAARLGEW